MALPSLRPTIPFLSAPLPPTPLPHTPPQHPFPIPLPHTPPPTPQVMQLMSQVLEVSQAEIKETVRRDRCDWLAAIYNLLIDQPEGRNILQSMITGDPADQLVDAAHYQGSIEHLRLSQAGVLWWGREEVWYRGGERREEVWEGGGR